ncbi:hypothetical protein FACS1894181_11750 [Bacteroidia bacterium]|nr:hypothetical protein FACS1894181_11750 [Bacteroidia bacterium]
MMDDNNDMNAYPMHPFHLKDGQFRVLEQRVPIEVQMAYFKNSNRLRRENITIDESDFDMCLKDLHDEELEPEHKKDILATLAQARNVKAYRLLEEYAREPLDPEIINWTYMALMESRIFLESEFLEEKQIYIATGLGGKGHRLRFYVVMFAARREEPFLDYQHQAIERELAYCLPQDDCEIERLAMHGLYVELVLLAPVQKHIGKILNRVLGECNQYGGFISSAYMVTNVKEPSEEDIRKMIDDKYGKVQDTI